MKLIGIPSMKEVLFVLFVYFVCHVEISVTMVPLTLLLVLLESAWWVGFDVWKIVKLSNFE